MKKLLRFSLAPFVLLVPAVGGAAESPEFFEKEIRPLLAENCFACHSATQMGGLRLDSREAILHGGARGPALDPGHSDTSLLMRAVRHEDPALKMPMGQKLSAEQIQTLATWIDMGAPWPEVETVATAGVDENFVTAERLKFWSFQPIEKPAPPVLKKNSLAKTNIDGFILAKLEEQGLQPAGPADKRTLIRRATLDLTGLPPTPEEVRDFLADDSPAAFEKVVDRLLASPRYGERWARHWLDVARYADNDRGGGGRRGGSDAYRYRDWVIAAFNEDLPYDQFVKGQIAADLLPEPDRSKLLPGLGLFGGGPWSYSAEPIDRADERDDRVDVVSRGFLGLTVACARCHDHKYDPIETEDYYALAGIFENTHYKEYALAPEEQVRAYEDHQERIKALRERIDRMLVEQTLQLSEILASRSADFMMASRRLAQHPELTAEQVANEEGLDQETLSRWSAYLARPHYEHQYLNNWKAVVKRGGGDEEARAAADEFQRVVLDVFHEKMAMEKENEYTRAKYEKGKETSRAHYYPNGFVVYEGFLSSGGLVVKVLPRERFHIFRDLFLSTRRLFDFPDEDAAVTEYREKTVMRFLAPEWKSYIERLEAQLKKLETDGPAKYPYLMGIADRDEVADIRVHVRGSVTNMGALVQRGFPSALNGGERLEFTKGSGRLGLAEAIVKHPLTARVMVNRIWLHHFGTGIVATPSNFGQVGERPTHPELLEYLAAKFRDDGWSVKKIHKEILMSGVYQRSSDEIAANFEIDPDNRMLWRFSRRRLEAESIRDSLLFVSGNLDTTLGGEPFELSPDGRRRTVYAAINRRGVDDLLALFDFPDPKLSAEVRSSTNVPVQRLFFLNSEFLGNQAKAFAKSLIASSSDDAARVSGAYWRLYGRDPSREELKLGLEFLKSDESGETEESRWSDYAQVLLSSNELLFLN